jgi:hypothetical protein
MKVNESMVGLGRRTGRMDRGVVAVASTGQPYL